MKKVTNTLRATLLLIVAVLGLSFTGALPATAATQQAVGANIQFAGNASGKFTRDGKPFQRPTSHTTPSKPQASFAPQTATNTPAPECPATLHCTFIPAAYQQDDPNDNTNWGNYDVANRGIDNSSPKITTIVIHDTEGSCASTIAAFQDPLYYVTSHYLVCKDGSVIQFVQDKNIAWHAGNYYVNAHSLGIEHEGNELTGAADYTPAQMNASALLVKWLAAKYQIPLNPQHIVGHQNVPGPLTNYVRGMHVDPGPFWDWQDYFVKLGAPVLPNWPNDSHVTTIAPTWPFYQQQLTDNNGVALPAQPVSFVPLYTQPSLTAPRVTDTILGLGNNKIDSRAAVAYYGQQFVVNQPLQFSTAGVWTGIWYAGQQAWFFSPWSAPNAFPGYAQLATPKAGKASAPVYGRAYPAAAAYPVGFPPQFVQSTAPLSYTVPAGQRVAVYGEVSADYYNSQTVDGSGPFDRTTVKDAGSHYLLASYNGRFGYLNKSDFDLVG